MFPSEHVNEVSSLKHWMKGVAPGGMPVFGVQHPDNPANKDGLLGAGEKPGKKNVFCSCLILETFENYAHLFIGPIGPRLPNRWLSFEGSPPLEGMLNNIVVKTEPG